jgi:hypothetical protein
MDHAKDLKDLKTGRFNLRCVDPPSLLWRLALIIDKAYRLRLQWWCIVWNGRHGVRGGRAVAEFWNMVGLFRERPWSNHHDAKGLTEKTLKRKAASELDAQKSSRVKAEAVVVVSEVLAI